MAARTETSFCRICGGLCGVRVEIDGRNRITGIRGDKANPLTQGYACIKGLQSGTLQHHPDRLLHPLKRQRDGRFVRIPLDQALGEIADLLARQIENHGPRGVAGFRGTPNYTDAASFHMLPAFLQAIGSPCFFSTMTIDQSAKWVTADRLGTWQAGYQSFLDADVMILAGINPLVSLWGGAGFPAFNPLKRLKEARERGMKLVVIDPRRTETARFADVFLQIRPGEDVTVAAALLNLVLAENRHDAAFCARYVEGLEALREVVSPFTPAYAAKRADIPEGLLREAAAVFAGAGKRGICMTGTGPDMALHSNLAEHLYECLNVICGRYLREGERIRNPGVMSPRIPRRAEVVPPQRSWERGPKARMGSSGVILGQMMSGILADEILLPGEGQIRSLFVVAGNPALVFPDQEKTVKALRSLDLLVTIDPFMTATAKLSHYVIPPTLQFERPDLPLPHIDTRFFPVPYAQYTPALVPPPEDAEVVSDWYVLWSLAKHLGKAITYCGTPLDMSRPPEANDLLALITRHAATPFAELRRHRDGAILDVEPLYVEPARPGSSGRFQVAPDDVVTELKKIPGENAPIGDAGAFTHLLISRRMREVMNSSGRNIDAVRIRMPTNPAYLNPDDLIALGLREGERIRITSVSGSIEATVKIDASVRTGAVSMSHGWGGLPGDPGSESPGDATSRLVTTDRDVEPINAMPRMSAIPVRLDRVG